MRKFLYLFLTIICIAPFPGLFAQESEDPPPGAPSPDRKLLAGTQAGGDLSGIYTPNLFDGTAHINIPVYQFQYEGANYGVSFGYHTKGVKVDEASSAIGLHWNLQNIPSVTRVVKDLPDEVDIQTDSLVEIYTTPPQMVVNIAMYIKGKLISYEETPAQHNRPNAYYDGEMDEFTVNLGNSSFSFYIGPDMNVFTHPQRRVKVTKQSGPQGIEFEIQDESGNRFYFVPTAKEDMKIEFDEWTKWDKLPLDISYVKDWSVSKVILADGREILYTRGPIAFLPGSTFYEYKNYYVKESNGSVLTDLGARRKAGPSFLSQLNEITYPNGTKVQFVYSTTKSNEYRAPLIDEVVVSASTKQNFHTFSNCLRYKLHQDTLGGRWFLNRLSIKSCDNSKEEPYYSFVYNSLLLPPRLNSGQDLYGYYNADSVGIPVFQHGDKNITIPKHPYPYSNGYGSSRINSPVNKQAGILKQVRNAYGGALSFFYGEGPGMSAVPYPNFYSNTYFIPHLYPDGLVLDSVKFYDPYLGEMQKTIFTYSGGQRFSPGGYFHYPETIDSASNQWTWETFQSMFLTSSPLVNGSNKGYSNVSVKTYAQNQLLSRTDYVFTNMVDASSGFVPRYFKMPGGKSFFEFPYTDKQYVKDWEIGLPLSITHYNSNNQIVQKTRNSYDFRPPVFADSNLFKNVKTVKVNSGTVTDYWGVHLNKKVFTDRYVPFTRNALIQHSVTEKYVNDTRFVSDSVIYRYDGYDNLKSTVTFDSRKGKTATELVYNYEGDGNPPPPGMVSNPNSHLYKMSVAGLEKVVSIERWKLPSGSNIQPTFGAGLLDAFVTLYDYTDGRLLTKGLYNLYKGQPVSYADYTGRDPGDIGTINPYGKLRGIYLGSAQPNFRPTSRVNSFDENGNPQESQILGEEVYKAMIWDKKNGQKLAEANCKLSDIGYLNFDEYYPSSAGQIEQGNFKIFPGDIHNGNAANGRNSFMLYNPSGGGHTAGPGEIHGTQILEAGREYILSYWFVNSAGPLPKLYINDNPVSTQVMTPSYLTGNKSNVQLMFTPTVSGTLKIKAGDVGNTIYIDELRLFPADAQMLSWSYEPLFGVSSETDPSGRITYYEYDEFGRLKLSRDMEGNIISKTQYYIRQGVPINQ